MKSKIIVVLSLLLTFALFAGCRGTETTPAGGAPSETASPSESPTAAAEETPEAAGQANAETATVYFTADINPEGLSSELDTCAASAQDTVPIRCVNMPPKENVRPHRSRFAPSRQVSLLFLDQL
jgi:hypothetical protein